MIPTNALFLLIIDGQRVCVKVEQGISLNGPQKFGLSVLSATREAGTKAIDVIFNTANELSVYRGKTISIEAPERGSSEFGIRFHDSPKVERSEIVLPEGLLSSVDRNVLRFLNRRSELQKAGLGTRRGVLFFGPPGSGKTLVTRYVLAECGDCTAILLTERQYKFIRESCELAKQLAPAIVVFEDVDLIATDRHRNRNASLLHELMDAMDGLGAHSDVVFVLSTNRPEVLEKALSARSGRVDQAFEFPLPDRDARRELLERFTQKLKLVDVDLDDWSNRTERASPAFLRELVRRAGLFALDRNESQPLKVFTTDFEAAWREIILNGGMLTREVLGFPMREASSAERQCDSTQKHS